MTVKVDLFDIPNQINHPCSSLKTYDPGGSSSARSKNNSLPVYSVSSSASTTKAFPTFLSAPSLIQVSHVLMNLVMEKFIASAREVDCPTSCLSLKLRMWPALKLIKSHKIIPDICHGSHGYIRVIFFGRCKFLQI